MIVRMKICTIRQSRFSYKISSELEYGLHFAAVLSRRDPRFAGGALEGTTKNAGHSVNIPSVGDTRPISVEGEELTLTTKQGR